MNVRRHPGPLRLGAFFDGEAGPEVGDHVAGCRRCQAEVHRLRRVRAALHGEPVPPPLVTPGRRWRLVLAPAVVALALVAAGLVGPDAPQGRYLTDGRPASAPEIPSPLPAPVPAPSPAEGARPADGAVSPPPAPATRAQTVESGPGETGVPGALSTSPAPGAATPPPPFAPLRLGVVTVTRGVLAGEGSEAAEAVRRVAEQVNRAGGVGGRPVEVVVVPAEDQGAVAGLARRVDVVVGGFGVRSVPGAGWLMPADPAVAGPEVVRGEPVDEEAGARLAADVTARGVKGSAGVVVGQGPEAALADGLARGMPTVRVPAGNNSSCDGEVRDLRRQGVVALAVAGPPELASRCADAAARAGWRPGGGLLLAPSAAYAHLELRLSAQGARTALGLPWPTGPSPGAERFRRSVPGRSYRAMVSFAAAELAVQMARAGLRPSAAALAGGHWRSDLYDFDGGVNRAGGVVSARFGRWEP